MAVTAAHVRQVCASVRWRPPKLSPTAEVSFEVARRACTDEGMSSLSPMDPEAIRALLRRIDGRRSAVLARVEPHMTPGAPERLVLQ